jgi:hypothetical protein
MPFLNKTGDAIISIIFIVSGILFMLWGNYEGDLWPIPSNPAPWWIRVPVGAGTVAFFVYFYLSERRKMKSN